MKTKYFNRNTFKKRVLIAKQRNWVMKIIQFYVVQFATKIKYLLKQCDVFNKETKHFYVCIYFEITIYDNEKKS